ncbi:MAG: hypothetical protein GY856_45645 [bacterium]|nr:hypothetical protein [bacterium]
MLQWNFSEVSARGSVDEIARQLHAYVNRRIEDFLVDGFFDVLFEFKLVRRAELGKFPEAEPRCYAVVAVGLERMLGEEIP